MFPLVMSFRLAIIESTVDLPQPEWPIKATTSPLRIRKLNSSTTTNGPDATGQHCPEGWTFHDLPGPAFEELPGFSVPEPPRLVMASRVTNASPLPL